MTAASNYAYEYLDADIGLGQVATRFHTSVRDIYNATAGAPNSRFHGLSEQEFLRSLRVGDILTIPFPGDPWEWRAAPPGSKTLADMCKQKPDPARAGGPQCTPEMLWFHIGNQAARRSILGRLHALDDQRRLDQGPSGAQILPNDRILVPHSVRERAPVVRATPAKGNAPSAIVATTPEWIARLRAHAARIGDLADALMKASELSKKLREEGLAACCHLAALHRLLALQIKHAPPSNSGALLALQRELASLQTSATNLCYPNPANKLATPDDARSAALAKQLASVLNEKQLVDDLTLAARRPHERVLGTTARALADGIQARAYLALAHSDRAGEANKQAEDALKVFNGEAGGASSALADYVGIVGNLIALPAAAVGNLAGPASLAVALAEIRIKNRLPEILGQYLEYKQSISVGNSLYSLSFRNPSDASVFVEWSQVENAARTEATLAREVILRGIKLSSQEVAELDKVLISGNPTEIRKIASDLAGKYQATAGWHAFMGILSAASLLLTISNNDGDALIKACNIVGGGITTGLGALQTIASLRPSGALGRALEAVGPHFGTFATVTGVMAGAISALTTPVQDVAGVLSGALQMVGGALSVAGFLLAVPGLQTAGSAVLIVSTAVGLWGQIDISTPGPAKVMLAQLKAFRERPLVASMMVKYPYLDKDISRVEDLIKANDHAGLYVMPAFPSTVSFLKTTGFKDEDIHYLAFTAPKTGPKL